MSNVTQITSIVNLSIICSLSFPTNDILRRLACETLVPLRHASLSPTDLLLLKAIIVFNPGMLTIPLITNSYMKKRT